MEKEQEETTFSMMEEETLDDTGLGEFEVTLRIHEGSKSVTPDSQDHPHYHSIQHHLNHHQHHHHNHGLLHTGGVTLTPLSPDDRHSTISLSSTPGGSPMFQPRVGMGEELLEHGRNNNDIDNIMRREESPLPPHNEEEAKDFFAYRDSIVNNVMTEVHGLVNLGTDGNIRGTWLLTEVDTWNHEWERIVVLCQKVLVIVKYDFIGMKVEDVRRLELCVIDKVILGELAYPQNSLTPKINGLAEGIAGVVKDCVIPSVYGTVQTVGCAVWRTKGRCHSAPEQGVEATEEMNGKKEKDKDETGSNSGESAGPGTPKERSIRGSIMAALSLDKFESKTRKSYGIQIIWNENEPLRFHQKWNPFDRTIPRVTFTSHPLFWHKGGGGSVSFFDVDPFIRELIHSLGQGTDDLSPCCRIEYKPIVIESYVGIASLLHNANSLGFYKVRGKVSF